MGILVYLLLCIYTGHYPTLGHFTLCVCCVCLSRQKKLVPLIFPPMAETGKKNGRNSNQNCVYMKVKKRALTIYNFLIFFS